MITVFIVFCLLTFLSCSPTNEEVLVKYVSEHSFPVSGPALSLAIQDADIVALSEAVHNGKESIETNVKLIEYLIQKEGFSIVALESALPESRFVNDYILGNIDALPSELMNGLDERYRWNEFLSLVEWMREYNSTHEKKVQMLGLDITGFYQSFIFSLKSLGTYFLKVDPSFAAGYNKAIANLPEGFKSTGDIFSKYRADFSTEDKLDFKKLILTTIERIDSNADSYRFKLGETEYEWFRRTAITLLQAVGFYDEFAAYGRDYGSTYGANGRELAMKENFEWIKKMNPEAKIVMINHIYHTRTQIHHFGGYEYIISFGALLRGVYGDKFYSVGCVYNKVYNSTRTLQEGDLAYLLSKTGKSDFFINLRPIREKANMNVLIWEYDDPLEFQVNEFDGYIYYDSITAPNSI